MPFDFKKEYKHYYQPSSKPSIIEIPPVNYIAVRGKGDPNEENGAYACAIPLLYGVAYTLKMSYKGLCVQCMHIGPYDDEPATIAVMDRYAQEQGYKFDMTEYRHHHEIYLSDPRKTPADKMKTVLRIPVKRI